MNKKTRNSNSTHSIQPPQEKDNREEIFSQQEVFDWLTFAQELSGQTGFPFTGIPLSPQLINQRMKDITLNTIGGVTEDRVAKALSDPKNNEIELLNISESFSISSMIYRRLLDYMSNILAFSYSTSCVNAKVSDYTSPAFKKDQDVLKEFFYKFDVKAEFPRVVKRLFLEEVFFGVLRDEGEKWSLQQLPSSKCLITGRAAEANLLYSFDYSYFLQAGTDINMFPAIFKKTYSNLIMKNGGSNRYIPSLPLEDRNTSSWIWWGDCSPVDNFWAWKLSPEQATRVPFFSGMFPDLAMQSLVRGLQKSNLMASAVRLILGSLPMLKDQKVKAADAFALDPAALAKFLKLLQSAIASESVRVGAAPLESMQSVEFSPNLDVYSSFIKTTLGTSGINSNLLFSAEIKPNIEETRLSVNIDEMISTGIYNYFNRFVEYYVNRKTSKFKFQVEFEGTNFYNDKERRQSVQRENIAIGIVNYQKIAASQDISPFTLLAQIEESKALGFVDKLTPIIPAAQMSSGLQGSSKSPGRPSKKDSELSDSGSTTKEQGSNLTRGGKI